MALCKLALLAVLSAACFAVSIQAVDLNVTQPSAAYPGFAGIYVETAETCGGKTIYYCADCTGTESDGQYLLWAPIPIREPLPYHWGFGTNVCDEDNIDTLEGNPNLGQRFVYNAEEDGDVPYMANFADDQSTVANGWEEMSGVTFARIQPTSEDNVPLSYFVITAVTTDAPTTAPTDAPTTAPTDAPTTAPTASPPATEPPTAAPTAAPTTPATNSPSTGSPTESPSASPTTTASASPTTTASVSPTTFPTTPGTPVDSSSTVAPGTPPASSGQANAPFMVYALLSLAVAMVASFAL